MFEQPDKVSEDLVIQSVTRSQDVGSGRTGSIVVTDGTGSFYESRAVFQSLFDFGNWASIVASSGSTADAKKVLISRAARYSGLSDILAYHEGATPTFDGADAWLGIYPEEESLGPLVHAASAAGVSKLFLLLPSALPDVDAIESLLSESGLDYTVMRTGDLSPETGGSGLRLGPFDEAVCETVPQEDVFRFITEALTLPEASQRAFSLCPAPGVSSTLKQMRLCGYERREEVQLLLSGLLREEAPPVETSGAEIVAAAELVLRSEAEVAAERADELKGLLERARKRGVETQARLDFEKDELLAKRAEWAAKIKAIDDATPGGDSDGTDDSKPSDTTTP